MRWSFAWIAFAVLVWAPRAEAQLMTSVGYMAFQPKLGDSIFGGSGVPLGGTERETFRHVGHEIGVGRPVMSNFEMRAGYEETHFELGLSLFAGLESSSEDVATNQEAYDKVKRSTFTTIGGAAHVALAFQADDHFRFSFGPDIGIRGFSIPLRGFEKTTCHSKYSTYPCDETVTVTQLFLQPRLAITYSAARTPDSLVPFVTGWVGGDLFPSLGMAGGLAIGIVRVPSRD